jgi:glycosyltransferase involved in cell wall biosynthesis
LLAPKLHFLVESTAVVYGGTGLAAQQLAQALVLQGVDVELHLLRQEQPAWPRQTDHRLRWSVLPKGLWARLHCLWNLGRADAPNAVVHLHGIWNPWWALLAQFLSWRGMPFVISPHGSLEPGALNIKRLKKRLALMLYQRRALRQASALVVTSEKEAQGLEALHLDVPIRIVPNGVQIFPVLNDQLHQEIDQFDTGTRKFLFLSRIHPIKGLPLLVRAWARVRQPGWRVVVAGNDEQGHLAEVKALTNALGVSDDFDFPGSAQGAIKQRLFAQADVFVLPTRSENFGIVVAEALGYGIPVITTHGAPWPGLLDKGCGWWCPITEEALARCMEEAMTLPKQRLVVMGAVGREWIQQDFNWNGIAKQAIHTLYKPLLKCSA